MPLDTTPASAAPAIIAKTAKAFAETMATPVERDLFVYQRSTRMLLIDALLTTGPEYAPVLKLLRAAEDADCDEDTVDIYDAAAAECCRLMKLEGDD